MSVILYLLDVEERVLYVLLYLFACQNDGNYNCVFSTFEIKLKKRFNDKFRLNISAVKSLH